MLKIGVIGYGKRMEGLVENFIGVMKGIATPIGSLKDGIASARLCLAAKKSATEHIFVDVNSTPKGE